MESLYCIKKGKVKNLTEGKIYQVVRIQNGVHDNSGIPYSGAWIINDSGIERYYSMKRFIDIVEKREKIINDILE